ncbi:serine/threonine-protein kinase [Kineosporia babensis]|uniref:non-specific serine/threonine protein kinase n=1 Tax=Kineosporia babensis TaxID=499548 RepID=A0A9X1NMA0_9ACTN|nr:serine/threonine-protein kinase PknG [Kineosporia babensis]
MGTSDGGLSVSAADGVAGLSVSGSDGSSACTEPGCDGLFEDGYCNVCGSPEQSSADPDADLGTEPVSAATALDSAGGSSPSAQLSGSSGSSGIGRLALGSRRAHESGVATSSRTSSGPTRTRGLGLGQGITTVPDLPERDPLESVLTDPSVPEQRRFCPQCGRPVGRSRQGRPGRPDGFCPNCRSPFSFTPKLRAGDLVARQYEVVGAIAHGGLGWIYLARDLKVSRRWVVLKGLLNTEDPDAMAAAIAEQRFLAQVDHARIVKILNFATHEGAGYIVMEHVSGQSLKQILTDRAALNGGAVDPLPPDQAVAFVLEVLPAFSYLHEHGLVFCDFKPDNLIQVQDTVKLIDLGGVLRLDEEQVAIYGTRGYQAPEIPELGASVASDIFTIGRTLLTLLIDFRGNTTTYAVDLPAQADHPVLARHDSLYQWLARACAADRDDRFASCEEMRVQLLGVLREVVAADREHAAEDSHASTLFRPPAAHDETLDWRSLPELLAVEDDSQLVAALAAVPPDVESEVRIAVLEAVPDPSTELRLYLAGALLEAGQEQRCDELCGRILGVDSWEWRAVWVLGLSALRAGRFDDAQQAFNAVYGEVPGELAPKLALALACEQRDPGFAEQLYLTCLRTDANYVAASAFGLARVRSALAAGGVMDVAAAYDFVPPGSRVFVLARRHRAEYLIRHGEDLSVLESALAGLRAATVEPAVAARLRAEALERALHLVDGSSSGSLDGVPAQEAELRLALEQTYRALVPLTEDKAERVRLVDQARAVRAWTWT